MRKRRAYAPRRSFTTSRRVQVYDKKNYYDEMKRIQLRIGFVRSMALVSLLAAYFGAAIALFRVVRGAPLDRGVNNPLLVTLVLALFVALQHRAFEIEEKQYNARAFGYWATMERAKRAALPGTSAALKPPRTSEGSRLPGHQRHGRTWTAVVHRGA